MNAIELSVERDGERTLLRAPEVGWFTCAVQRGRLLVPGEEVGRIETLSVSRALVVPAGVSGRVTNDPPERVHEPTEYGAILYELEALSEEASAIEAVSASVEVSELVVRAPHTGRFWHRSAPNEPSMASEGDVLVEGAPVGLIEVMKTFTLVPYRALNGLPERARVKRVLVDDGSETEEGDALLEVEPA